MKRWIVWPLLMLLAGCASPVSTPIPSGFKVPSGNGCAGTVNVARGFGDTTSYEGTDTGGIKSSEKYAGAKDLAFADSKGQVFVLISLESLSPGNYVGDYKSSIIEKKGTNMTLEYQGRPYYSFVDEKESGVNISIEGNQGGYVWGSFSSFLNSRSETLTVKASGNFSCKLPQ